MMNYINNHRGRCLAFAVIIVFFASMIVWAVYTQAYKTPQQPIRPAACSRTIC